MVLFSVKLVGFAPKINLGKTYPSTINQLFIYGDIKFGSDVILLD